MMSWHPVCLMVKSLYEYGETLVSVVVVMYRVLEHPKTRPNARSQLAQ